ncbi:MAG: hypothetical protein ABI759_29840 [Candidatus Solibacter sp.]
MTLTLLSIQFRDVPPDSEFAVPLRQNPCTVPLDLPEWQPAGAIASVAYCLDRTAGRTVEVQVTLHSPVELDFEIKAEDATGQNLSGSIPVFGVSLQAGVPAVRQVRLSAPRLTDAAQASVEVHDDEWQWFLRLEGSAEWVPLLATRHRVYTLLSTPNYPWSALEPEQFVWTDALDFACTWATGARDAGAAATQITRRFYALGEPQSNPRLVYDSRAHYVFTTFQGGHFGSVFGLIDLIRYLNGSMPSNPGAVDCHDCASAVSTLANALGAALFRQRIGFDGPQIHTNVVRLIGGNEDARPFDQHELAWGNTASDGDPVWDACLMVDFDDAPAMSPHTFDLAAGTIFSQASGLDYRARLAVRDDAAALIAPGPLDVHENWRLEIKIPTPDCQPKLGSIQVPSNLGDFLVSLDLSPWHMAEWSEHSVGEDLFRYMSTVLLSADSLEPRLHVDWYRCQSVARAGELFVATRKLMANAEDWPVPGDACYRSPDGRNYIFRRANVVVQVSLGGMETAPIADLTIRLDNAIVATFGQGHTIL